MTPRKGPKPWRRQSDSPGYCLLERRWLDQRRRERWCPLAKVNGEGGACAGAGCTHWSNAPAARRGTGYKDETATGEAVLTPPVPRRYHQPIAPHKGGSRGTTV